MRSPVQITRVAWSNVNYHGRDGQPLRNTVRIWRLGIVVPAWRLCLYGSRGQWWHLDVFFRGFRG